MPRGQKWYVEEERGRDAYREADGKGDDAGRRAAQARMTVARAKQSDPKRRRK